MKTLLQIMAVVLLSATTFAQTARVQVIHNSANAAAAEVDVYLNSDLLLDDFAFRTSSPFVDAPADVAIDLSVAPSNSTGVGDAIFTVTVTLAAGETYIVVANGIVSPTGYNPAQPFGLDIITPAREAATDPANADVVVMHGSTDAPTVDVVETGVGAGLLVDDLSYTESAGYLELPAADYVLQIRDETGTVGVAAYSAPLATLALEGTALTVVASGFLDPSQNSNGASFGLWVATAAGGPMLELPSAPLGVNDFELNTLKLFPNPSSDILNIAADGFSLDSYSVSIIDLLGRTVIKEVLKDSNNVLDISSLNSGIYVITVQDGNKIMGTQKFVKR